MCTPFCPGRYIVFRWRPRATFFSAVFLCVCVGKGGWRGFNNEMSRNSLPPISAPPSPQQTYNCCSINVCTAVPRQSSAPSINSPRTSTSLHNPIMSSYIGVNLHRGISRILGAERCTRSTSPAPPRRYPPPRHSIARFFSTVAVSVGMRDQWSNDCYKANKSSVHTHKHPPSPHPLPSFYSSSKTNCSVNKKKRCRPPSFLSLVELLY